MAANGAVEGGATEGTVLLGLGAVGGERVGESTSGRSRVDARSVVNRLWEGLVESRELGIGDWGGLGDSGRSSRGDFARTRSRALADEADERGAGVCEGHGDTHDYYSW